MITKENLIDINKTLETIDQKGKAYVMVNKRVMAFRELEPSGSITTDIIHIDNEKVVMKSTVSDEEGRILATGIASEKFDDSFITKTSAFEVCETSSVGRALGMLGIGIDSSMASAEEVANAILNQNKPSLATEVEKRTFTDMCALIGESPSTILTRCGWKKGQKMTSEQYVKAMIIIKEIQDERGES